MATAPATLAEGPLGLKGWTVINGVTLNDRGSFPRYKVTKYTGLRDRPDADDNRAPNTGRVGESPYPSLIRGKTIVIEGIVQAMDPITAETAKTALLAAFVTNDPISVVHKPPATRGGVEFTSFARILGFTVDDDFSFNPNSIPSPWQANFSLTYRMHHPWFYESTDPHTATDATGIVCVNGGTAPTEPKISVIHSADDDVTITHAETGLQLKFDNLPGGTLIITFLTRTATISGTSYIDRLDDDLSTWWDEGAPGLIPGTNTVDVSGASGDTTVDWLDAVA